MVDAAWRDPPSRVGGIIFDVDGVLIASPHERAWRDALAELMSGEWRASVSSTTYSPERFTTAVYQEHVAGKARLDGARALLDYFGVADAAERAIMLGERKQAMIETLIERCEFEAFPDALRLVLALRERGVALGVASSSRNADRFMAGVHISTHQTLGDMFDANVSGRDLARGKPFPDIFLLAASELGVAPERCVVVEDAPSGIQAARAAGARGLGVARLDDADLLEAAGAELVVSSLDLVDVDALVEGHLIRKGEQSQFGIVGTNRR